MNSDKNKAAEIRKHPWGNVGGREVSLYELSCAGGITVKVSDYGGILQSFFTPEPDARDIVLGYDTVEEYVRSSTFFGAFVGPLADRTGGARLSLAGKEILLEANAGNDCMHSGSAGFHARVWNTEILPDGVCFSSSFEDDPLPGKLDVSVFYSIPAPDILRITYEAACSEETALSFTNHSYFNLEEGTQNRSCLNDRLTLFASQYAETDCSADPLVTGNLRSVEGTPFDFRGGVRIGDAVSAADFPEIESAGGGVDNYFLTDGSGFRPHAHLRSADGKTELLCMSDAPGVLVYSGNGLQAEKGKGGEIYGKHGGIAFETENFPNAVNIPVLRSSVLIRPGERFHTVTEYVVNVNG
ncbi:MAG: aldose epimerase family protein [Eubacteriales bacterium]|nr:aldose epimerase family protein [Eubacteriales bacterium]